MDDEFLVVFIDGGKEFVMACFNIGIFNGYIFEESQFCSFVSVYLLYVFVF